MIKSHGAKYVIEFKTTACQPSLMSKTPGDLYDFYVLGRLYL